MVRSNVTMRKQRFAIIAGITAAVTIALYAANVPSGSPDQARAYYRGLATTLGFRDPVTIFTSTLDDVTAYMGYQGLGARDLQRLSSAVLMDPGQLTSPCTPPTPCAGVENPTLFQQTLAVRPLRSGDILAARFFAPKIININDPPATRQLGWRKLIRLRVQPGSMAAAHQIDAAIILLNFFTNPGETPFDPSIAGLEDVCVVERKSFGSSALADDRTRNLGEPAQEDERLSPINCW